MQCNRQLNKYFAQSVHLQTILFTSNALSVKTEWKIRIKIWSLRHEAYVTEFWKKINILANILSVSNADKEARMQHVVIAGVPMSVSTVGAQQGDRGLQQVLSV